MAFRIGRKHAQHVYPERPAASPLPFQFARNFAQGPATTTAAPDGTQVPWSTIESGAAPGVGVPITPRVTGRVRISAVVQVKYNGAEGAPGSVTISAQVGGVTIPGSAQSIQGTLSPGDQAAIPYLFDTTLPLNVVRNIELIINTDIVAALQLLGSDSTIDLQELTPATG